EERANQLACALRARGARPGRYVAVCLGRGLELVVALLGVAKSGAAYVPLDPDYPHERLEHMLADTQALLVITEERFRSLFASNVMVVDAEARDEIARMPTTRVERLSQPTDACYAIFTSGSTGTPKGVVLSHRAVVNTFDWVTRTLEVGPGDRLLFVTSPCFDLSVYDVFGTLGAGATVVVAGSALLKDAQALAEAIVLERITIWDSAPAALQRLVPFFPSTSREAPLRLVMLSGDWIPITLPDELRRAFPAARVVSLGGATEAAIWSNWFPIAALNPRWASIPYGRPIQNARYHVLDARMRPSPSGVAGDLYIGGACLAEGYLNRPELTAERFVRDPFADRPGERLYRTGDLARYFDNGDLEFLGRSDFQVKIRGFRIELGEIEAALSSLAGVRQAACATYVDASGQKSLVAYVVPTEGQRLDERALLKSLAAKLPDFMVPSQAMVLPMMPLSSNGKLDRAALPSPNARAAGDQFVAPRTATERAMKGIWEELLARKQVGVTDSFFELGGHSLLAVMLVSRVKSDLGLDLPLSRVLERPTIRALAASLEIESPVTLARKHVVTFNAEGKAPPLVLCSGGGGYGFVFQGLAAGLGPDQPVHVFDAVGADDEREGTEHSIE
ncbi:MAG TPA: non-ribosomal peptide synthetase, partial [Polyangiaceae bacterium]